MLMLIVGIIIGFVIGASVIEFLLPRAPRFFETLFTKLDSGLPETYCQIMDAVGWHMRNKGWYQLKFAKFMTTAPLLIDAGISKGEVLEIGPGPDYLGLEWLNNVTRANLVGIDNSIEMIGIATRNAHEYNKKAMYVAGDANRMPFANQSFDAVFSSASLHEWGNPRQVFNEIYRILKPEGVYYIVDLKRNMALSSRFIVWLTAWPSSVRPHFLSSVKKAYTIKELRSILDSSSLHEDKITESWYSLIITGKRL